MSEFSAKPAGDKPAEKKRQWKAARDPRTGRVYYYDILTRETQWTKPTELLSDAEKAAAKQSEDQQRSFFDEMERNMRSRFAKGMQSADLPSAAGSTAAFAGGGGSGDAASAPGAGASDADEATKGERRFVSDFLYRVSSSGIDRKPSSGSQHFFRTLSTLDDSVLADIRRSSSGSSGDTLRTDLFGGSGPDMLFADPHRREALDLETSAGGAVELPKPLLEQRNSTGTIFVDTTMSAPDKDATIHCVCTVIRVHILNASKLRAVDDDDRKYAVFNDRLNDASGASEPSGPAGATTVPSLREVLAFFRNVFTKGQLETECVIMTLIYIERLIKQTRGRLQIKPSNWKSVLLIGMIMASKVWDDLSMWNADFGHVCPSFTLERINELELAVLDFLKYSVCIGASEYAKYYFHLRSMSARLGLSLTTSNGLQPLNIEGARKLEALTERYEKSSVAPDALKRRCVSLNMAEELAIDAGHPPTPGKQQTGVGIEHLLSTLHETKT